MSGLTSKVAVVVGAGSGIGRAAALHLSAEGALVVIVDANADAAASTEAEIGERLGSDSGALAVVADATSESQIARAVEMALEKFSGVDVLVNCVARGTRRDMFEITLTEWQTTIEDCLHSYFIPTKAALPHLVASGHGKIVNVCSANAHVGAGIPAYTAAKGAILSWSREIAMEFAHFDINVNSVSPGIIETAINSEFLNTDGRRAQALEATPLGRLGRPDDVAAAISFLASSEADFITGTNLMVDGGLTSASPWGGARDTWRSFPVA